MSTKKNARTSKGKLENLTPKSNPVAGSSAHGSGGGSGKVSMQDFHFTMK
jgi:hypothetical protein